MATKAKNAKRYEELNKQVSQAMQKVDATKLHRFDHLLDGMKRLFDVLQKDFGWTPDDFKTFYPDQTIEQAKREGWVAVTKPARRRKAK